jgi:predicted dehydrogenase
MGTRKQESRRQFLQTTAKLAATGTLAPGGLALARSAYSGGSDTIRIGLVGCGGRGTQAAQQAMNTEGNVELVAVADVFQQRIEGCLEGCRDSHGEKVKVDDSHKFTGFDGYKSVIDSNVEMVLLVTPPGFRPLHFEAAIAAGKHVFMEKPVAVDVPGVRRILKANEMAKQKNLAVAVGLQRRHEKAYIETIDELRSGIIGDLICSRVYWNSEGVWLNPRQPGESELQYQMRNWYYFNWICGDHIVEQHIHNMDVINWLLDDYPVSAQGQGGRLVRTGPDSGQIYDHHFVEYTYENGHKMFSQCRHMPNCFNQVSEYVYGTSGYADISGAAIFDSKGERIFRSSGGGGHQQEHHDLFANIRSGQIPNEGDFGAKSTMTAIIGRLATYTGRLIKWEDAMKSNISLCDVDNLRSLDDKAPLYPDQDGKYFISKPSLDVSDVIDF